MRKNALMATAVAAWLLILEVQIVWGAPQLAAFPLYGTLAASRAPVHSAPSTAKLTIKGTVMSGPPHNAKPITQSTVTLYLAAVQGFPVFTVTTATTATGGNFTMLFSNTPQPGAILYLVANGGLVQGGKQINAKIGLLSVLGIAPFAANPITPTVNELTTVAAEWALARFFDATGKRLGSATNATPTSAATQIASDLVDPTAGTPASFLPAAAECSGGSPPINCDALERLSTLANILVACIESVGPSSGPCKSLFTNTATPSTGTTVQAAHAIATNPTANVGALFAVQTGGPFGPGLPAQANDFTLALNFAPAGAVLSAPVSVALDSDNNLWVANSDGPPAAGSCFETGCGSVSELTAESGYRSGLNFAPAAAGLDAPQYLAVDSRNNIWVVNYTGDCSELGCGSVSELTTDSNYASGINFAPTSAGFNGPESIALDSAGNVWVGNEGADSISYLISGNGSGHNFAPESAGFNEPEAMAVDSANNVWVANESGGMCSSCGSVSELTVAAEATGINFDPPGAGFDMPDTPASIALDRAGNVWVANFLGPPGNTGCFGGGCGSVSELTASSNYSAGLNFNPPGAGFDFPRAIALDATGNVWIANECDIGCGSVSELSANNNFKTGLNFAPPGAGFNAPEAMALDAAGNVWVANFDGNSVSELIGLAKPVLTPQQACLIKGHNVCSP